MSKNGTGRHGSDDDTLRAIFNGHRLLIAVNGRRHVADERFQLRLASVGFGLDPLHQSGESSRRCARRGGGRLLIGQGPFVGRPRRVHRRFRRDRAHSVRDTLRRTRAFVLLLLERYRNGPHLGLD